MLTFGCDKDLGKGVVSGGGLQINAPVPSLKQLMAASGQSAARDMEGARAHDSSSLPVVSVNE